jgi:hypothetical protein
VFRRDEPGKNGSHCQWKPSISEFMGQHRQDLVPFPVRLARNATRTSPKPRGLGMNHARQQLARAERLDDIIVGAGTQYPRCALLRPRAPTGTGWEHRQRLRVAQCG